MRHRTIALLAGGVAAAGAAVIGATTATMYRQLADEKHEQALRALARAFFGHSDSMARIEAEPDGRRPELVLVKGGQGG